MGLFGRKKQNTESKAEPMEKTAAAEPLAEASDLGDTGLGGDRMVCRHQLERALTGEGQGVVMKFYIENFKRMNELFGFAYCEELLKEILEYLKENRIPTALASSTRRTAVMEHLDRAGITSYFQKIICGDMVEHGKPAPDIYLKACEELGVAPGQALAVEDSFNGIRSAYAAGLYTVMVPDQLPPTEEILALVDKKCDSLTELQAQLPELLAVCGD